MPQNVFRQGDVAFILREDLPNAKDVPQVIKNAGEGKAKLLKTRTIRRGEHGGIHALEKDAAKKDVVYYELDGVKYIISPKGVGIVHGEHNRVDLPPGKYEVRVQREARGRDFGYVRD